jgi:hypothetical protein
MIGLPATHHGELSTLEFHLEDLTTRVPPRLGFPPRGSTRGWPASTLRHGTCFTGLSLVRQLPEWLQEPGSNRRHPSYEPGALPLRHPAKWMRHRSSSRCRKRSPQAAPARESTHTDDLEPAFGLYSLRISRNWRRFTEKLRVLSTPCNFPLRRVVLTQCFT